MEASGFEDRKGIVMVSMNGSDGFAISGRPSATIRFSAAQCSMGSILVAVSQLGICAIMLGDDPNTLIVDLQKRFPNSELIAGERELETVVMQVIAFVEQPQRGLNLPLDAAGTAFQKSVWQQLREIPFGQTRSYLEIAHGIGKPTATRAVAQACGANPIAVAIPCHRVVRADGSLSGYRWGIARKAKLLEIERNS